MVLFILQIKINFHNQLKINKKNMNTSEIKSTCTLTVFVTVDANSAKSYYAVIDIKANTLGVAPIVYHKKYAKLDDLTGEMANCNVQNIMINISATTLGYLPIPESEKIVDTYTLKRIVGDNVNNINGVFVTIISRFYGGKKHHILPNNYSIQAYLQAVMLEPTNSAATTTNTEAPAVVVNPTR